ncbi:hypothetical protein CUMW_224850 [Citrus unshiu]|uniref:NB-ARC domain-containing protein n=1 Tax=Citrus unshiu TaxID=55188 RepID=A0A2H5QGM1_CITUN|nr:hypothetical protein CUMW_224850 [Citrus unshiu]
MGGIGKTTLAREVYNDKAVGDSKFDVKAWVCVSDVFDVLGISKALLESITRRPCLLNSLNEVQVELKVAVDKKRFLLVLDDVWNEDYSLWVDLKAPFLGAAPNNLSAHRISESFRELSSGVQFLEALEDLDIEHCPKLESIPDGLHNLKCLQSISIYGCPSLVSFPERGLPHTISRVFIASCVKLEALPNDMHKLNSLRDLSIQGCPNLASFPEEGFRTNLTSLTIGYFKMCKTLVQWGLHRLTSLRGLQIIGCDDEAECFPDEEIGMTLPTSLTHLHSRDSVFTSQILAFFFPQIMQAESFNQELEDVNGNFVKE